MKNTVLIPFAFFLLLCVSRAQQSKKQNKYSIVYNIHVPDTTKDDWEIIRMNFDGSEKKNIINNNDVAWTYYANGNTLYFISDRDTCYRCFFLYSCDKQGNNVKKISDIQLEDSWMSGRNDGAEILVSGRKGTEIRYQLFIINTKNGVAEQLTNDTAAMFRDPCFSPDGKRIVCSYKKNRRDKSIHEELFIMNEDGSNIQQLTSYPENNPSAKEYGYRAGSARWHPKENFITYVSKQDGRHSIFAITPDGKKQWKLLENSQSEGWHEWSADGKWLVYNSSDNEEKQFNIELMNWQTKERKALTHNEYKSQLCPVFIEE